MAFRVQGSGFLGCRFRVQGFRVLLLGFYTLGLGLGVQGAWFKYTLGQAPAH